MTAAQSHVPADDDLRVENLPPVEPPSAGFIVQLFVVPALIVGVVCGLYFLFARAATTEYDWRQLVADIKSENPHIRWRAALGLSQALESDRQRREQQGNMATTVSTPLAENAEVAGALCELYSTLIATNAPNDEQTKQIEFLSKAIGLLDLDEATLPVLRRGAETSRPAEIRKHSMTGLVMIVGRRFEKGTPIGDASLQDDILAMSREPDQLSRHQATFVLGLIPSDETLNRARELLNDGDQLTRVNAAIALARNESLDCVPALFDVLRDGAEWKLDPAQVKTEEQGAQFFEQGLMVTNSLKALDSLHSQLTSEQRTELVQLLDSLIGNTQDRVLKSAAEELRFKLK